MMEDEVRLEQNLGTAGRPDQPSKLGRQIAIAWQKLLQLSGRPKSAERVRHSVAFVSALAREAGFIDVTPAHLPEVDRRLLCERHVKFFTDIPRALGQTVRVYVAAMRRFSTQDYQYLTGLLDQAGLRRRIFILIVPGQASGAKSEARYERTGLVVIDSDDVEQIAAHSEPSKVFYRIIRQQTPVDLIQPYDHFGATRPSMFFGRHAELGRIMLQSTKSFAIFGGRRAGKTSLLLRLRQELSKDTSNWVVSFSAQGVKNIVDFSHRLLTAMQCIKAESTASAPWYDLEKVRNQVRREILISGKRVAMLIDEIDDLVRLDKAKAEPVMSMLRSLDEELGERCRFVFAGFRVLYDRLIYYYSPVMNFLEPIPLGGLNHKAARQLIEVPLCKYLGYDIPKPEVVGTILDYSSHSPWQIQHFCGRLVQTLAEREKDTIDEDDVQHVFEDFAFRTDVVETVLANLSPEQMAVLCIFLDSTGFSREEVYKAFEREKISIDLVSLGRRLDQMVKFEVFNPPGNKGYTFAYTHLPEIIKEVEAPARLFAQAKMQIKQQREY